MKVVRGSVWILFLILLSTIVLAQTGHMKLLAVAQTADGEYYGSAADLYLTIDHGEGRVFLETFPLSKIDTQISTRFAKEVACKFVDADCDKYDFFYTIHSKASIIGGPSAGGAIAVLTASVLDGQEIDETVAMSGTINSGDLIGPVGGLKEKIEAAKDAGVTKVLIPSGGRFEIEKNETLLNATNTTTDLVEFGQGIEIEVIEVIDLNEALYHFTGKLYEEDNGELEVSGDYTSVMSGLAEDLCQHADAIVRDLDLLNDSIINDENFTRRYESGKNFTSLAEKAMENGSYYSAASFCFSAGVEFRKLIYLIKEINESERSSELADEIDDFDANIRLRPRKTMTDLQAYMIVKERILEAREGLEIANSSYALAYVTERLYSGRSWSKFFGVPGQAFALSEDDLRESCVAKLGEVDERVQFVELFFPGLSSGLRDNLEAAYDYFTSEEYELCLFKASKTKAEANVLVSVVGVSEDEFDKVLENKFFSARKAITKQAKAEIFPIIAYSYYEYGQSLLSTDKYAALLYAEYALELSNLDMYFEQKRPFEFNIDIDLWLIWLLLFGLVIGFIVGRLSKKKAKLTQQNKGRKLKLR